MPAPSIPPQVARFIRDHVASVAQLEIIVLLHGRDGDELTADVVARQLGVDTTWVAAELRQLAVRGILHETEGTGPRYRFAPASPDLGQVIDLLVRTYRDRRVAVVTLIFEQPDENVRTFADAFRLRKD